MPPHIRAQKASLEASEKRLKERTIPGSAFPTTEKVALSPKKAWSTTAAAGLTAAWPDGYSWNAGVTISGVQPESWSVSGLLSVSPKRIAVMGCRKL